MSCLNNQNSVSESTTATAKSAIRRLLFKNITLADMPQINRILQMADSRTCDYTVGGIFMWISYFHYQYCIYNETLFIKGVSENNIKEPAFSLPIGAMPISDSIELLKKYCALHKTPLRFSAIPEDRLADFRTVGLTDTFPLNGWADYLYDIEALATLKGNKLSKKRNHVNRFISDNPHFVFEPLTTDIARHLEVLCREWMVPDESSPTAKAEYDAVIDVLNNLICYPFEGYILRDSSNRIVAFTLGEIIGDTLFVHIEKMCHDVTGAGETINKLFAERMLSTHPFLRYVNREEDTGDDGLRKAKLSYHPAMLLRKYDITI